MTISLGDFGIPFSHPKRMPTSKRKSLSYRDSFIKHTYPIPKWEGLEIIGSISNLSPAICTMTHLTALYLNDNSLTKLPSELFQLTSLCYLDLSSNKLLRLPPEIGNFISLRELLLTNNRLSTLPVELGKLFEIKYLGLRGNPLTNQLLDIYNQPNGTTSLIVHLFQLIPHN